MARRWRGATPGATLTGDKAMGSEEFGAA
jgi:hypothetical protein